MGYLSHKQVYPGFRLLPQCVNYNILSPDLKQVLR